jgi:hypothetical protein
MRHNVTIICEIRVSHCGVADDSGLQACDAVTLGKRLPTFPARQHHIPEDLNSPSSYSQCTVTDLKQLHARSVEAQDYVQHIFRPSFNLQGKAVSSLIDLRI